MSKYLPPDELVVQLSREVRKLRAATVVPEQRWTALSNTAAAVRSIAWRRGFPQDWDWFPYKGFRFTEARRALYNDWLRIRESYSRFRSFGR